MARGWESKSVESNRDDIQADRAASGANAGKAERELKHQREGIEMSRRRVARELESTKSPLRRSVLESTMKYLDDELQKLDRSH